MISVLLEKITQDEVNFEQLGKTVWKPSLDLFQHLMAKVLITSSIIHQKNLFEY